jgi:hypothetical protein
MSGVIGSKLPKFGLFGDRWARLLLSRSMVSCEFMHCMHQQQCSFTVKQNLQHCT